MANYIILLKDTLPFYHKEQKRMLQQAKKTNKDIVMSVENAIIDAMWIADEFGM